MTAGIRPNGREVDHPSQVSRGLMAKWGELWCEMRAKRLAAGKELFFAACPNPNLDADYKHTCEKTDHAFSAVFAYGWRTYAFTREADRDHFVDKWERAIVVEDPIP